MDKKPKILYLVHAYHNRGGVEWHTKTLASGLSEHYEISVVFPQDNALHLIRKGLEPQQFPADTPQWPVTPYSLPRTEQSLAKILEIVQADLVHVQHFLNWHLGVLDQLSKTGTPVVCSFHEYYAITPHFTMQHIRHPKEVFTSEYCKKIFQNDISEYMEKRRRILIQSFSKLKCLIVPSMYLALELSKVFPWEYKIIEHGIRPFPLAPIKRDPKKVVFGYLGTLVQQKGWQSLLDAFPAVYARHPNTELHFFGGGEHPEAPKGISFHNSYEQEDLGAILPQLDVGIIPSIFRETYCYVLSEMQHAGLPVAVSNIGALGTRVTEGENGRKFRAGDVESISNTLSSFVEDQTWRNWNIPKPRLLEEMLKEYQQLYDDILSQS